MAGSWPATSAYLYWVSVSAVPASRALISLYTPLTRLRMTDLTNL